MPKRKDENETAFHGLQELIRRDAERDGILQDPLPPPEKVPSAVRAGRLGGKKGGPARAAKLFPKKRSEIAKKAAEVRWQSQTYTQLVSFFRLIKVSPRKKRNCFFFLIIVLDIVL